MAAYKLPKATDDDKARRAEAIQASLRRATETPLDCARACAEVIALARRASERGYLDVISDGGVGRRWRPSPRLRSAALNVYINVPALKDRAFAERATAELEKLVAVTARSRVKRCTRSCARNWRPDMPGGKSTPIAPSRRWESRC